MTFLVDIKIKRVGHIIVIEGLGTSVNFHPKNYDMTLNALIERCIELQPDLTSDKAEMDYLRHSIDNQLTDIYKDYEEESSSGKKKKNKDTSADGDLKPISKRPHPVYKYSKKGKADLHDAVILAGLPVFLKYENGEIKIVEKIEETARVIVPPNQEEYPYEPYEFSSMEEVREFVKASQRDIYRFTLFAS